jgi:hypothetical protein
LAWLVMLSTGLVMYFAKKGNGKKRSSSDGAQPEEANGNGENGGEAEE